MVTLATNLELGSLPSDSHEMRLEILSKHSLVNLSSLLDYCWEKGIAVVYFNSYPDKKRKITGMIQWQGNQPVIVLSSGRTYPAYLAFHLAHELGHLALGHVKQGEGILIDEEIKEDSDDQEEKVRKTENKLIKYEQLVTLAKMLPQISEASVAIDIFEQLYSFENIDLGEAILTSHAIALLKNDEDAQIFTGDKRFLTALAKVDLPEINTYLKHRIWCLEQLVSKNIDCYGFEFVREQIVPVRDCVCEAWTESNRAIKAVFGSGDPSSSCNAIPTLKQYIEDIRGSTGNLLSPYPNSC